MKKLLLIALLIVGCDKSSSTAPQVEDCAGVAGGTATNDDCGVCDDDASNDNTTCEQDCAGVWGGDAILEECEETTEPENESIISLPTEFPLVGNTGWVYQSSTYNTIENYLSGSNPTITLDTIVILDTSQDYYLWHTGSNIDSNSVAVMYKNYDNKFLLLGTQKILSEEVVALNEKPLIMADFILSFNIDDIDITNYSYFINERTTKVDTLFDNLYSTYVFKWNSDFFPSELSSDFTFETHFMREGMSYYNSARYTAIDGMIYYSEHRMIEKLDYIETNEVPSN